MRPDESPAGDGALFEVRYLRKRYPLAPRPALEIPHLRIPQGGIVAVLGFSGAGKSTLLNLLGGLDEANPAPPGEAPPEIVYLDRWRLHGGGRDASAADRHELQALRRREFGFVFQESHLLRNFDAAWNVELPLHLAGRSASSPGAEERHARARRLLEAVGLTGAEIRRLPRRLSVGQGQRIALVRALAHDPRVVFADEATGSLDPVRAEEVLRALADWCRRPDAPAEEQRTVLWVTHNVSLAAEHARHFIVMSNGHVIHQADGPVDAGHLVELLAEHRGDEIPTLSLPRGGTSSGLRSGNWLSFAARFAAQDLVPRSGSTKEDDRKDGPRPGSTTESGEAGAPTPGSTTESHEARERRRSRRLGWRQRARVLLGDVAGNALNVFVVAGLVLTALLIAKVTVSFRDHIESSFIDPRVNYLKVHPGDAPWIDEEAVTRIAALRHEGKPLVSAAHGAFSRLLSIEQPSVLGDRPVLDYWAMDVDDPILQQVPLLETAGPDGRLEEARPGSRVVADLFRNESGEWVPGRAGAVATRDGLRLVLGHETAPEVLRVARAAGRTAPIPLLGVTDWLPGGRDLVMPMYQYLEMWTEANPLLARPGYDLVLVYPPDIRDAQALVRALQESGLEPETDILRNLDWVRSTERLLGLFIALGLGLLALLSCSNLFLNMAQTVRRKRNELGVLLAFGAPRRVIFYIFTAEALLTFAAGAGLALLLEGPLGGACEGLLTAALQLGPQEAIRLTSPSWLVPAVLGGTGLVTLLTTCLAVRREMAGLPVAELVRSRE